MEVNPLDLDLYKLSDILDAKRQGEIVWVVETQMDADCLINLGLLATAGPGSRSWLLDLGKAMRGRRVAVIHRADEYGRQWAAEVIASLIYWNSLRIAIIEAGVSVDEWLRHQKGREQAITELMGELKTAPRWERTK